MMENSVDFAKNASVDIVIEYLRKCNKYYYNNEPIVSDSIYDIIKDILDERDPNNSLIEEVGAPLDNEKVKMPYYLGSIDKIKTTESVIRFSKKFVNDKFHISDKLDGTSALLIINKNLKKMYKRGDRVYGRDISQVMKFMKFPVLEMDELVIRGELVISKKKYDLYKDKFANARNMVNGVINKKTPIDEYLQLVDFVCFEVIKPRMNPIDQYRFLEESGFMVPKNKLVSNHLLLDNINNLPESYLYKYLGERKNESEYDIDGIIISHNIEYDHPVDSNPKHSVAFKVNSFGKVTKIIDIEWNISKHGKLVPCIEFAPLLLGGSTVRHCSGFNAKKIEERGLGIGSIIRVVLSGEIIPIITEVIEKREPKMPDIAYKYINSVDICPINLSDSKVLNIKRFVHFFKNLKIDNVSEGIVCRLIDGGYDSLFKILTVKKEELLSLEGFKKTLSDKIYNNIHSVIDTPIRCELLMVASLCFGYGYGLRRLKAITSRYINILERDITIEDIVKINSFEVKTAKKFIDGLPIFKQFLLDHPFLKVMKIKRILVKRSKGVYSDKRFVLSGSRDANIIKKIEDNGGVIQSSINSNTTMLIVKDKESPSQKIDKAKKLGITILSIEEFNNLFDLNG